MSKTYEAETIDDSMIGATIVDIRPMTREEMNKEGWRKNEIPMVLVLSTGTILYPSQDTEGNDAGALFGVTSDGISFGVY
jgi:fumarylacetoacetate (FAA) hydrolase family protein